MRWLAILILTTVSASAEVRVVDGDTLEVDGVKVRIHGIDAPETFQTCGGPNDAWRCGDVAADRLVSLIAGRDIDCKGDERDQYGRLIARCFVDGRDIGAEMVKAGMAWAFTRYSDDYVHEEQAARRDRRGVWSGDATPAWEVRADRWASASTSGPAPKGCPFKGNISKSGRIYHMPWSRHYDRTKIDPARGERWFCSEAEALEAGWRAPYR